MSAGPAVRAALDGPLHALRLPLAPPALDSPSAWSAMKLVRVACLV